MAERTPAQPKTVLTATVKDYLTIVVGCVITAVGLDSFLIPFELAAGGASGLATIIYHLGLQNGVTIPVGLQTLFMNVFLMIPVVRAGGFRYASRTTFGIIMLSISIDVLAPIIPVLPGDDVLLAALWGGVLSGVGLGLVFRVGGNTGGTDILAQLIARKSDLSVGIWMGIVDVAIVAGSALVFSPEKALYAGVSLAVTTWLIDKVVDGISVEKAAWVISRDHATLAQSIMADLDRGCTKLEAQGMYSGEPRPMLFVVLRRNEVGLLKKLVEAHDPDALIFISDVHEAFGEGFRKIGDS